MFRAIKLPEDVTGELYLHSMPGRFEDLEDTLDAIEDIKIDRVIALTADDEVREKSPDYSQLLEDDAFPVARQAFPIPDFDIPSDPPAFLMFVEDLAAKLQQGERVLVHCAGGIGRSGLVAVSTLMMLGTGRDDALLTVRSSMAGPETPEQDDFLEWVESVLMNGE